MLKLSDFTDQSKVLILHLHLTRKIMFIKRGPVFIDMY